MRISQLSLAYIRQIKPRSALTFQMRVWLKDKKQQREFTSMKGTLNSRYNTDGPERIACLRISNEDDRCEFFYTSEPQ